MQLKMGSKKVLCFVNHYYNPDPSSIYKSGLSAVDERRAIVEKTLKILQDLNKIADVDIKVCGIRPHALVNVDLDFSFLDNPQLLVYESLKKQVELSSEYDYILNVEDDIEVPAEVLSNVLQFDKQCLDNEILHPNRVEYNKEGKRFCIDMVHDHWKRWTFQRKLFEGKELGVSVNPHSAILILSSGKINYLLKNIDIYTFRKHLHGYMASAYAFFHQPFVLYRPYENLDYHYVVHLDKWKPTDTHAENALKKQSAGIRLLKKIARKIYSRIESL